MADKSSFTADQWDRIIQAPLLAGFAISAADPNGFIGALQEGMASAQALAAAKTDGGSDELIKAVVDDLLTPEGRTSAREGIRKIIQGVELNEIKIRALEELRSTAKILDATAPLEARPFKNWLSQIAWFVAEASAEGGFLGFGGEKISAAERATLAEIAAALGA
ncbi:hypothetical protein OGR47_09800 [Methylocystis sp. MJC1]|jgi:hypothetical protein|uniref:hypothetical protein n=1 Tax=Methylocystis sp. MJC1 TaxID=2654282 RepID=UPI0013EC54A7|nr:hypothetical protein [Methylocystis sp. MJC1]KAF2992141.1 hypothetical protein MJC1_00513 [Methylocystis sp. MJC1]MBU6527282.1 hypothetical protein [Methylocystis sp. MJC1]UZX10239.1 hypothetical protein OGR47_09800 [Methylocystis sp. MJC1]